jgi:DNA polymerase I-like protein with 3'-5' exonuclease and polymerase domains
MKKLQAENARLTERLAVWEQTHVRIGELGGKVEQLLQKYLETEQIRTQQAAQISGLRREVEVFKRRLAREEEMRRGIV